MLKSRTIPVLLIIATAPGLAMAQQEGVTDRADSLFEALEEEEIAHGKRPAPTPETPAEPAPAPRAAAPAPAVVTQAAPLENEADKAEALEEIQRFIDLVRAKGDHTRSQKARLQRALAQRETASAAGDHHHHGHSQPVVVETVEIKTSAPKKLTLNKTRPRFRVGIEMHGARGPSNGRTVDPIGIGGVDLGITVSEYFTVGLGRIGILQGGSRNSDAWALNSAPYLELHFKLTSWFEVYGQAGITAQWISNNDWESANIGLAPYSGLGARAWIGRHISLGPTVRGYYVWTDRFAFQGRTLPQGAMVVTGGFDAHLHF